MSSNRGTVGKNWILGNEMAMQTHVLAAKRAEADMLPVNPTVFNHYSGQEHVPYVFTDIFLISWTSHGLLSGNDLNDSTS